MALVDGFPCVTLGHGLTSKGVEHAFYGTQRCIDALRVMSGWEDGFVEVRFPLKKRKRGKKRGKREEKREETDIQIQNEHKKFSFKVLQSRCKAESLTTFLFSLLP